MTSYEKGKMLMFDSQMPEPGYFVYRGDKSFFLKMDDTDVVHMQAEGKVLSQSTEAPSKKKVPFTCTARLKDVSNSANAKLYLNDHMAQELDKAFDSFEFARKNLETEKRDYREAAAKDGSNLGKLNSNHGEAIFDYARKSNGPAFREALESCKAIPSPRVQEQASLYIRTLDNSPKVMTGSAAGATR